MFFPNYKMDKISIGKLKILFLKASSFNLMCLVVKKTYDSKLGFQLLNKIKSNLEIINSWEFLSQYDIEKHIGNDTKYQLCKFNKVDLNNLNTNASIQKALTVFTNNNIDNIFDIKTIYTNDYNNDFVNFENVSEQSSKLSTSSVDDDLGRIVMKKTKKWCFSGKPFGQCLF